MKRLVFQRPAKPAVTSFVSDPNKPVPYTMDIAGSFGITPRSYMSEDQARFAASRPDVASFLGSETTNGRPYTRRSK
jgi:hypothetical protein